MIHRRLHLLLYALLLLVVVPFPPAAVAAPANINVFNPTVTPLDDAPFGINSHLATRYPDPSSMNIPADVVAESGAGWVREDIHWFRIQPTPNTWDWTFTDQAFSALLKRKLKIVGVLGHPPGWATPYTGDASSEISFYAPDPQQFAAFTQAVVRRYGQYVDYWEIWNEPDHVLFWRPQPDPIAYATLLQQTSTAIKSIDPQAKILLGGINPFDTSYLRRLAETGAWKNFDIIAIHPYVDPASPETGMIASGVDNIRGVAARYGMKPIWVTEIGWSSGPGDRDPAGQTDANEQANRLVRATLLLWQAGVERIFWYTLKDDLNNPYGMVPLGTGRADFSSRKPAFRAFQTLSKQLRNTTFVGMRDLFSRTMVFDFEDLGTWRRGDEPNGSMRAIATPGRNGNWAASISYNFPTSGNDYVVFMHDAPIPLPGTPAALSIWTYGDGSGHSLRVWLRDAEGEILQYTLGTIGAPGWRALQAPINGVVPSWNRMSQGGNGKLDFPANLYAILLDDTPETATGSGTVFLDDLTALSGPEAYDIQLKRENEAIDVLWAPTTLQARLPITGTNAILADRDGANTTVQAQNGVITLNLGPSPIYVHH